MIAPVEIGAPQVGFAQIGLGQVGAATDRRLAREHCCTNTALRSRAPPRLNAGQIALQKHGLFQRRARQIGALADRIR